MKLEDFLKEVKKEIKRVFIDENTIIIEYE